MALKKIITILFLSFLTAMLFMTYPVYAPATESDYVNGFTDTVKQWTTHTGASPWLDNNTSHSIGTYTTLQMDANYTFANTAIPYFANITTIELTVSTLTQTELARAVCYLSTGGAWSSGYTFGGWGDSIWHTDSLTVTSLFSTLTNINNCVMKINSSRSGASASVAVRKVRLTITYSSGTAYSQTITDNISVTDGITKNVMKTLTDNVIVSDGITKNIAMTLVDNISVTDSITMNAALTLIDDIISTDSIAKDIAKSIVDNIIIIDSLVFPEVASPIGAFLVMAFLAACVCIPLFILITAKRKR